MIKKQININTVYQGDNIKLLKALQNDYFEKIKCIYIDPPFAKNYNFLMKNGSTAYSDKITGDNFILFLKERIKLAYNLLSNDGFFWLHTDQTMGHYIKVMCDEVFGFENFVADIITARVKKNHINSPGMNKANDNLLVYKKSKKAKLNPLFKKSNKKPYWHAFDAKGQGDAKLFNGKLIDPPQGCHWRWKQEKINKAFDDNKLRINSRGRPEYLVVPQKVKIDTNWMDIAGYSFKNKYPTEKNVEILKRIIQSSTNNKNDIVLDFFVGSGTTVEACKKLNRSFIVCDQSLPSINTIKNRFSNIKVVKL